ncbi:MAG: hypothetical protein Q8908_15400 [Bacteroidota bacterium]|nr:hypothetical protein [Bacteroidota bacterium]
MGNRKMIPVKLQLFAEPVATPDNLGATSTAPSEPAPSGQPETNLSLEDRLSQAYDKAFTETGNEPPIVNEPSEPHQEPPAADPNENLLAGKFKDPGELVRSYQNLQGEFTKKSQAISEQQKTISELEAKLQELSNPPQQPPQINQPSDEFEGMDSETMLEQFYTDPKAFISKVAEMVAKKAVEPIEGRLNPVVQRAEQQDLRESWGMAINNFQTQYPDMNEFSDGMKEYITENGLQSSKEPEKVLKFAYGYAKGLKYTPPTDPKTLLADEAFKKTLLENPELQNEFAKIQMAKVREGQIGIPPTIHGNSAGNAATMPPQKAGSISEVTRRAADRIYGD